MPQFASFNVLITEVDITNDEKIRNPELNYASQQATGLASPILPSSEVSAYKDKLHQHRGSQGEPVLQNQISGKDSSHKSLKSILKKKERSVSQFSNDSANKRQSPSPNEQDRSAAGNSSRERIIKQLDAFNRS